MVEVLLVLVILITKDFQVEDLLCGTPSCSEARLFFNNNLLHFWLESVQYGLKHDFAWVADEADCSVVLALLLVAFFVKCHDQGLGPRDCPFSCLSGWVVVLCVCLETVQY